MNDDVERRQCAEEQREREPWSKRNQDRAHRNERDRVLQQCAEIAQQRDRTVTSFRARAMQGFLMIAASLLLLAGWYFRLQVLQHAEYSNKAEANRIKQRPIVPARG